MVDACARTEAPPHQRLHRDWRRYATKPHQPEAAHQAKAEITHNTTASAAVATAICRQQFELKAADRLEPLVRDEGEVEAEVELLTWWWWRLQPQLQLQQDDRGPGVAVERQALRVVPHPGA